MVYSCYLVYSCDSMHYAQSNQSQILYFLFNLLKALGNSLLSKVIKQKLSLALLHITLHTQHTYIYPIAVAKPMGDANSITGRQNHLLLISFEQ